MGLVLSLGLWAVVGVVGFGVVVLVRVVLVLVVLVVLVAAASAARPSIDQLSACSVNI